jgi:CheY-like chemotaxis protein/type II secretory pathway component PulM
MMARRALVVDDSKSARAFLTRILERYELAVDGVETAEQAIEYLTVQRPDVIFMDHLMPGMDGFQAVQAIKNNPRTATIPIMMYTSQEGELYLSQARALGAIGVLPKQIKHADVSQVLQQLHLLGEPELEGEIATVQTPALPPEVLLPLDTVPPLDTTSERRGPNRPKAPPLPQDLRLVMEGMLAHHMLDVRRFITENLESNADRVVSDLRLLMQDQVQPSAGFEPSSRPMDWKLWLAAVALVAAFLFGLQWSKQRGGAEALSEQLTRTQQQLNDSQQNLLALQAADAAAAASVPSPPDVDSATEAAEATHGSSLAETVPFGETPLAGARLERVSGLLTRLTSSGFHGVVQIRSIPGRFCTVTGPAGTPVLASEALLYSKCEQVGNSRDDSTSASQRESVAFANMISTARENAGGKIDVQVSVGNPEEVIASYPVISDTLTAGEWNRAAAANNRVEVHWQLTH